LEAFNKGNQNTNALFYGHMLNKQFNIGAYLSNASFNTAIEL